MKSIIDGIYKSQSEEGDLSRAAMPRFNGEFDRLEFETLQKEVINTLGKNVWGRYDAMRTSEELNELEIHYKQGLKDGAKLILELLR